MENSAVWRKRSANIDQGVRLYIQGLDALALGLKKIAENPAIDLLHEYGVETSKLLFLVDGALLITTAQRTVLMQCSDIWVSPA